MSADRMILLVYLGVQPKPSADDEIFDIRCHHRGFGFSLRPGGISGAEYLGATQISENISLLFEVLYLSYLTRESKFTVLV